MSLARASEIQERWPDLHWPYKTEGTERLIRLKRLGCVKVGRHATSRASLLEQFVRANTIGAVRAGRGLAVSPATAADLEIVRVLFERQREREKIDPAGVEMVVSAMVLHLRRWRPVAVRQLGVLPRPEAPIADPRRAG